MKYSRLFTFVFVASAFFFTACGGDSSSSSSADKAATAEEAAPAIPDAVEISIAGDDAMKFDQERLEAFEGQEITLTLTHSGQMAKAAMGHNWVLLAKGTDMTEFATAAMTATETEYIPADMDGAVIAHTTVIGGGESTSVTFTAPESGVYDFICSFPGHYAVMKGTFVSRGR